MFANYAYNSGATQANILSDLVAILTGTTDKTTLSAACDQANTTILNTYKNAGWAVHDSAPAANAKILKATCVDGVYDKYFGIDLNTAGTLKFGGAETWNAGTHAGTNMIGAAGTTSFNTFSTTTGFSPASSAGNILIYAEQAGCVLVTKNSVNTNTPLGCFEHTRLGDSQAVGLGYPCWAVFGPANIVKPRAKSPTSAGDITGTIASCGNLILHYGSNTVYPVINGYKASSTELDLRQAIDIRDEIVCQGNAQAIGSIGQLYEIYGKPVMDGALMSAGSLLDEFTFSGKTYVKIANSGGAFSNQAGLSLWVPKG